MKLIDELEVPRVRGSRARSAVIQLLAGDLSSLPSEHAVDALVVSAFPDSYGPSPGTLFESLHREGLDMRRVARRKQEDERSRLGCWLSEPLAANQSQKFKFSRIICFEPKHPEFLKRSGLDPTRIEDSVGFVFRCLNNFVIPDETGKRGIDISRIAMPLLATGNQRVPLEVLFPRLLEAAVFWLEHGLPLDELKIVAFSPKDVPRAEKIFNTVKSQYRPAGPNTQRSVEATAEPHWERRLAERVTREVIRACTKNIEHALRGVARGKESVVLDRLFRRLRKQSPPAVGARDSGSEYDVFISYAHKQTNEVAELNSAIERAMPGARIFLDRTSIPAGGQWIKLISDAIQRSRAFVAVLSPDYTASPVCWDEFQCAKLVEYDTRQSLIRTIRLYSEETLPPIMGIYSYIDCAEGNLADLRASAAKIVAESASSSVTGSGSGR